MPRDFFFISVIKARAGHRTQYIRFIYFITEPFLPHIHVPNALVCGVVRVYSIQYRFNCVHNNVIYLSVSLNIVDADDDELNRLDTHTIY